jgi:hypothetical protein
VFGHCDWIVAAALNRRVVGHNHTLHTAGHRENIKPMPPGHLTLPTPVTMPPAGTSSFPYRAWPASWESSRKGEPGSSSRLIRSLGWRVEGGGWRVAPGQQLPLASVALYRLGAAALHDGPHPPLQLLHQGGHAAAAVLRPRLLQSRPLPGRPGPPGPAPSRWSGRRRSGRAGR